MRPHNPILTASLVGTLQLSKEFAGNSESNIPPFCRRAELDFDMRKASALGFGEAPRGSMPCYHLRRGRNGLGPNVALEMRSCSFNVPTCASYSVDGLEFSSEQGGGQLRSLNRPKSEVLIKRG